MKVPLFLIVPLIYLSPIIAQDMNNPDKFDVSLVTEFESHQEVRYFIQLVEKPDFKGIQRSLSKEEKGKAVFNTLHQHARKAQAPVLNFLDNKGVHYRPVMIVNAILTKTNFETAKEIAALDQVRKLIYDPDIQQDLPKQQSIGIDTRSNEPEWGILNIQAEQVWQLGFEGQNVVIGGADTGFDFTHPTLIAQYRGNSGDTVIHDYHWRDAIHEISPLHGDTSNQASLNPCGLDVLFPCDDNNHGTHTMGTMVGRDTANQIGVAPEAKWIACRNMERGWGSPSTYIECFEWFLAPTDLSGENPDPLRAPDVINNSWSCPEIEGCNESNFGLIQEAIHALRQAGIVVVVSAGNRGPGCFSMNAPPSIFDESFSVGAYQVNDSIAPFSSRGPAFQDSIQLIKPDISAPGVGVRSAIRNGGFASFSGTSMAGPHVAGTIALMISANPDLRGQVDLIEEILISQARGIATSQDCGIIDGSEIPNNTYGHGNLNALAAVETALELTVSIKEPTHSNQIFLYPNPANHSINWKSGSIPIQSYRVYQMNGQMAGIGHFEESNTGVIDVTTLPPGLYVIHFQGNQHTFVRKVSISR